MSLNDIMNRLAREREERERKEEAATPQGATSEDDKPFERMTDGMPTLRDLATALYSQKQGRTCHNCIRRERGDCPSSRPMPKTCISFALNSKQMQTYGRRVKNFIEAIAEAKRIARRRAGYQKTMEYINEINKSQQI